jgi:adenosine deaminase
MTDDAKLIAFIDALPKAEHHLHLEGSSPWHIMQADEPDLYKEPPPSWKDDFRFADFGEFENVIINQVVPWLNSPERYAITAREILNKRMKENVRYAEISFAALAIERSGVDIKDVASAVKSAIPDGIEVRLFVGLHHQRFEKDHDKHLEDIINSPDIDGIDLHGPEEFPLQSWIPEFWRAAELAGKLAKAHAGELTGALGVRQAIEELGVTKIQHGVQVMEDENTLFMAVAEGASFDVCPISNVKLKAVPSMAEHPIMKLEKAGIRCTINTDDPFIFGNSLRDDYLAVSKVLGATPAQLAQFAKNGFETSQMDSAHKRMACAEIDTVLQEYE